MTAPLLGAIEAGGTKFVLAVGRGPDAILERAVIPTLAPGETLDRAADWLASHGALAAIGIATFGPAELDRAAPRWGHILGTPKPGWANCDLAGHFARRFAVPIGFDTDVNGAALAEMRLGAGHGCRSLAYVTVGTGIGGGLIVDGSPVHGIAHPEMGHFYPRRAPGDDFAGTCPHHGDCLEGLASGLAIEARWGASLSQLPPKHPAHAVVANYIAQLCHAIFATTAAATVVLGGGVTKAPGLIAAIRAHAARLDAGYLPGGDRHRIEPPALGENSGIAGALLLAEAALATGAR